MVCDTYCCAAWDRTSLRIWRGSQGSSMPAIWEAGGSQAKVGLGRQGMNILGWKCKTGQHLEGKVTTTTTKKKPWKRTSSLNHFQKYLQWNWDRCGQLQNRVILMVVKTENNTPSHLGPETGSGCFYVRACDKTVSKNDLTNNSTKNSSQICKGLFPPLIFLDKNWSW